MFRLLLRGRDLVAQRKDKLLDFMPLALSFF